MPTSNLQVLWILYAEKDALCISNELGRWMKNSMQSLIIRVEGYSILKHDGMFFTIFLREGNTSSSRNFTYMRFIHVTNTRLSVGRWHLHTVRKIYQRISPSKTNASEEELAENVQLAGRTCLGTHPVTVQIWWLTSPHPHGQCRPFQKIEASQKHCLGLKACLKL